MKSRSLLIIVSLLLLPAVVAATPASGAVGVEKVSRPAGKPGASVALIVGCGFCYPPCHGAPGERQPSPCMLDSKADPPASFPISLVPIAKAPLPRPCGARAVCSPITTEVPRRSPYTYLGEATASPRNAETGATGHAEPPRYELEFEVPDLKPGTYAYVIYCDVCLDGGRGSLLAAPAARPWRLKTLASGSGARTAG
jgi:hypothetical protein